MNARVGLRESAFARLLGAAVGASVLACTGQPVPVTPAAVRPAEPWLVFDNLTLVDILRQNHEPDTRIVVRGDRVVCVGRNNACNAPVGARRIDAGRRWVIPGLTDAHVHLSEESGDFGPLYLAFGITSVRDLGGYADTLRSLRARIDAGTELGPRIFFAGHPIDGDPTVWPAMYPEVPRVVRGAEGAREAVRRAIAEGADFIKLYSALSPALVRAAASEAHARGRKVTIDATSFHPDSLIAAGVDGFEHRVPAVYPPDDPLRYDWARNRTAIEASLDRMLEQGVSLTTTLVLFDRLLLAALPTSEPTFLALPASLQERSATALAGVALDSTRQANRRRILNYWCETVRSFAGRGGRLMAGTDSYYLTSYPGDLHRELELLVSCGATVWQALAAATQTPMEWLAADSLGRVASGAVADFLLLRGDPVADIRNTRQIEFVVQGGRIYTPAQILGTVR